MTKNNFKIKAPNRFFTRRAFSKLFTVTACASVFLLSLFASERLSHSVRSALSLCSNVIIPSVFPFMVISDFLYAYTSFSSIGFFGDAFERIFRINRMGMYPFVLGMLCGFPLGVKCASELYRGGMLSKDEAERIIGFCNNTGPAFLVSGVGLGLRGSIRDGILLYLVMMISALFVGMIFSIGHSLEKTSCEIPEKAICFSFTDSIKNAGINTLNICSYLTFFACIVGMLRSAMGENHLYLSLISFLEVGSATSILSKTKLLSSNISLTLSSFAVGFSGMSVHLQAISFIKDTDLGLKRYFVMKLLQGVFSALIIYFLYIVIG